MLGGGFVLDKTNEVLFGVAARTQFALVKPLIAIYPEAAAVPVAKHAGDPLRHRLIAYLDVQLVDFFDQENSLLRLAVGVEQLPADFILLGPAPVKPPETQI